jgi:hypothetical protein
MGSRVKVYVNSGRWTASLTVAPQSHLFVIGGVDRQKHRCVEVWGFNGPPGGPAKTSVVVPKQEVRQPLPADPTPAIPPQSAIGEQIFSEGVDNLPLLSVKTVEEAERSLDLQRFRKELEAAKQNGATHIAPLSLSIPAYST